MISAAFIKPAGCEAPATDMSAEELIARGYRRVSNALCAVARIDKEDWIKELAKKLHMNEAEFYPPGEENPNACWCSYYRAVMSRDILTVPPEIIGKIPSSMADPIGYVDNPDEENLDVKSHGRSNHDHERPTHPDQ